MREGDKKISEEEKKLIVKLYKAGFSFIEMGKRMKRDHTTMLFQVKKMGIYNPQRKILSKEEIEKEAEKEIEEKRIEKEVKLNLCFFCKGEKKDLKWVKSNYCSLKCWDEANS